MKNLHRDESVAWRRRNTCKVDCKLLKCPKQGLRCNPKAHQRGPPTMVAGYQAWAGKVQASNLAAHSPAHFCAIYSNLNSNELKVVHTRAHPPRPGRSIGPISPGYGAVWSMLASAFDLLAQSLGVCWKFRKAMGGGFGTALDARPRPTSTSMRCICPAARRSHAWARRISVMTAPPASAHGPTPSPNRAAVVPADEPGPGDARPTLPRPIQSNRAGSIERGQSL